MNEGKRMTAEELQEARRIAKLPLTLRLLDHIAALEGEAGESLYGKGQCQLCGWSLAKSASEGCVTGNCSYRPDYGSSEYLLLEKRRDFLREYYAMNKESF